MYRDVDASIHSRKKGTSSMNIYKPYTYLIGWTKHNKWYYGVRFAKNCHPNELWSKYYTSSKYVKEFRSLYGEPNIIQIRKTFDDHLEARAWEHKVLRRTHVITENKWLNKCDGIAFDPTISKNYSKRERKIMYGSPGKLNSFYGKSHNKETQKRITLKISKKYILTNPNGSKIVIINLYRYCIKHDLNRDALMVTLKTNRVVPEPKSIRQWNPNRTNSIGYQIKEVFKTLSHMPQMNTP
jgi:hypothetical protein